MRVLFALFISLLFGLGIFYFLTGYRSAFEADQACHAQQWLINTEETTFDCDHDIETNQWILFQPGLNHEPAKVVRRFRY